MRALAGILLVAVTTLLGAAPLVEAVVVGPNNISTQLLDSLKTPNFLPPSSDLTLVVPEGVDVPSLLAQPIPNFEVPIEPAAAVAKNVVGATGGLTHPACIAETQRRAAMKPPQPPPAGDFPCIVPASNGAGIVDGVCFVNVCKGVASTGLDGLMSALKSIGSLSGIVTGILSKLIQGGGGGESAPPPTSPTSVAPVPTPVSTAVTSQSISPGNARAFDPTILLKQSAVIVQDLLHSLNPQVVQVPDRAQ